MSQHLQKIFELEGFITLEQLDEHRQALTIEKYQEWYQCLDNPSLLKLVKDRYNPGSSTLPRHKEIVTKAFMNDVFPILLKRFEQQQTEIDSLNNSLIDTKRELRLAKKFANLEDSDPF